MTGGDHERSGSAVPPRLDETRPTSAADLEATTAGGALPTADTELVRVRPVGAEPPMPGPGRPLTASAVVADTELLRLSARPGAGAATRGTASAVAADTELLRLSARPGSGAATGVRPGLEETTARPGGDETQRFAASGEETVLRSDVRFAGATELPPELQAVLAEGRVGRFLILRELGRGAMGVVLAAYDEELDRKVAIKLLHVMRSDDASHGRGMLLREAQAMARLSHPNVVAVHEVGIAHGAVFVAMEYVAGVDLQQWLAERERPWREVVAMFRQAAAGLAAAHREGLVHRDFKPSNVLVGEDGRVRVADFGLAARRGAAGRSGEDTHLRAPMTATLAPEGALVGTPVYMAPELLRGGPATARSDQFAFCVSLYEGLYGARPFAGDTLASLTEDVEGRALPTTPPRADVPTWLHLAVRQGLARAPEQRLPSLDAWVELLARDPEEERRQRRRRALQIGAAIVATAAVVTLVVVTYGVIRRYAAERQAEGRLAVLRAQIAELRARGEDEEAGRLLRSFVTLPENHGLPVVGRAYLEWAGAQRERAAAVDAYASAYINAGTEMDSQAALRGLIEGLAAQGLSASAAAAVTVLERSAPEAASVPELQEVRLAAALQRRDLAAAGRLTGEDEGWRSVFTDLSRATAIDADRLGGPTTYHRGEYAAMDIDGDGRDEVVFHRHLGPVWIFRADAELTPLRKIDFGERNPNLVRPLAPVAGVPLLLAGFPTENPAVRELRLLDIQGEAPRVLDRWEDSSVFHAASFDCDGDGRREIYVGTEAYVRKLWRIERAADGTWSRRIAHRGTDAAVSDIVGVVVADLEGDGEPELVVPAGPWNAYDLRVFKPAAGELDLVVRRAFGSFNAVVRVRGEGRDLVGFLKHDFHIAPNRFPEDRPLGEPAGLYVVGLREGQIEVLGHVPERVEGRPSATLGWMHAGDLDGDGHDELVVDAGADGMHLVRVRPGEPLRLRSIAGVRPMLVHDLDGDGEAEIVVQESDRADRVLVLGTGTEALPPLPALEFAPRPIPPGIADPVIAGAWTRAEQLVAVGLPKRTADELAAIARLSGHVSQDMLLRAAELYAGLGEDAAAAESYAAAATRPDLAATALAGATAARRRLGEFAAAAGLARERAQLPGVDAAEVAGELAALTAATAPRPELALTFTRPLDARWQIADPVNLQRSLSRRELSVWTSGTPALAEYPLVWDGGPVALEVEFEADKLEWGTQIAVEVIGAGDAPWLSVRIEGHGVTHRPETVVSVREWHEPILKTTVAGDARGRARIAVYPRLGMAIREIDGGPAPLREVGPTFEPSPPPPPGPSRLRVRGEALSSAFVGHAWISAIRLTGWTPGAASGEVDEAAWLLAEGQRTRALAALQAAPAGSERQVWRVDALLGLGEVRAATREIAAMTALAEAHPEPFHALLHRLRRGDPVASLAARDGLGERLIELLLVASGPLVLRPGDVEFVLEHVPAPGREVARDPEAALRLTLTELARALARTHVGRFAEAVEVLSAGLDRLESGPAFPERETIRRRMLHLQISNAAAMEDRPAAVTWIRRLLAVSETPYLILERLQSDAALTRLLEAEVWTALAAELRAARP